MLLVLVLLLLVLLLLVVLLLQVVVQKAGQEWALHEVLLEHLPLPVQLKG